MAKYLKNNSAGNGRISTVCQRLILKNPNLTNTEIAKMAKLECKSKTTKNCISWYKSKMKIAKKTTKR